MYKIEISNPEIRTSMDLDVDLSYSYEDAKKILIEIRALNEYAEMYPEEYSSPRITEEQAMARALAEYDEIRAIRPDNYGEFTVGVHTPIYYCFYCRDFDKEEAGMAPGMWGILIDKLSGNKLSQTDEREYRRINYNF